MKKINQQYRQGDVLLLPVDAIPTKAIQSKRLGPIILAEGEATGHAHKINRSAKVKEFDVGTELYLEVEAPVELEHEEHGTVVIEPGCYQIRRQVEVWMDEARQVAD